MRGKAPRSVTDIETEGTSKRPGSPIPDNRYRDFRDDDGEVGVRLPYTPMSLPGLSRQSMNTSAGDCGHGSRNKSAHDNQRECAPSDVIPGLVGRPAPPDAGNDVCHSLPPSCNIWFLNPDQ